jgi:miniconductance mechanosensitive channel
MFDNMVRFEHGPGWWPHVRVYTDSWAVAVFLVFALLLSILLSSIVCYYLTRMVTLLVVERLARKQNRVWLRAAARHGVFHRLAPLVPAGIVYASAPLLSGLTFPIIPALGVPLEILAACFMAYTLLRAALALRDSIEERYSHVPSANERPIKSFLQIATIFVYIVTLIAVASLIMERSPLYLLTGLSAVTALLIFVFRDALLGFVASIQIAAYDMLRVGDWVEVPGFVADGTVIDIALNTIKVRNFDNTIVMLPSQLVLTNSVKNWRGMTESGARRVQHSIHIDVDTIAFPDDALLARVSEMMTRPVAFADDERRTNLGLYRRYLSAYFSAHPAVRRDMPVVIRHVQTAAPLVALEIYLYLDETRWEAYESLQSDLLDHAYGVVPLFGLRCWQRERMKPERA